MLNAYRTVLVTGGLGFVGRHLVRALAAQGKAVVIADREAGHKAPRAAGRKATRRSSAPEEVPAGVRLVRADLGDPAQAARLERVPELDLIFHLAANASGTLSVAHPRRDFEANVRGTFNVLELARRREVRRVVYVSSASVYGRPQRCPIDEAHPTAPFLPYGASKLCGEVYARAFVQAYGLPVVIARPFCVYGPGEDPRTALVEVSRYLRWHLNRRPIQVVGDPRRKTRDFVHVDDLVRGLLLLAEAGLPGEAYNVGSGTEVSMHELVELIGAVTGRSAQIEVIPEITEDSYRLVADIAKLKALGYTPRVDLATGLGRLAEALGDAPELPQGATIFRQGQRAER